MPFVTRRGQLIAIYSVVTLMIGLVIGDIFIFFIGILGIAILIHQYHYISRISNEVDAIYVERVKPVVYTIEGSDFDISFRLVNNSGVAFPRVVLRDIISNRVYVDKHSVEVYDVFPGESIFVSYCGYAGVGHIFWNEVEVLVYDSLSLFVEQRIFNIPMNIFSYPRPISDIYPYRHIPLGMAKILSVHARSGLEFLELREYEYGDDFRMIHWPSTARYGDLVVKVTAIESKNDISVVLDVSKEMWVGTPTESPIDHASRILRWLGEIVGRFHGTLNMWIFDGFQYRFYRYISSEASREVDTLLSRLSPGRFRSQIEFIKLIRRASLEARGHIFLILTGPGIEWEDFIFSIDEASTINHPITLLAVSLPTGSHMDEKIIYLYEASTLDELTKGNTLRLKIIHGSTKDIMAKVDEVFSIWL